MTRITLIRHGETLWNADGRFQGQQDIPLNETGRAQARITAEACTPLPFTAIYTSDLSRAWETAELIAAPHHLTPIRDARLREASFGEWEGCSLPEIAARWPEIVAAWRLDSLRTRPPGGETLEAVQARVADLLTVLVERHPDEEIAVVAHGGSVRAMIVQALGGDLTIFRRMRLDNCAVSVICGDGSDYALVSLNDTCHLGTAHPRPTWDEAGDQWRRTTSAPPS
jgi:alpha-ribazole phosphatase